jgi:hypothetical protein
MKKLQPWYRRMRAWVAHLAGTVARPQTCDGAF